MRDDIAVCDQLVPVFEVPDVVQRGGRLQVVTGVMQLDLKQHVLAAEEHIVGLVDCSLLGDADRHWDLI